jgi:hypothetical protein
MLCLPNTSATLRLCMVEGGQLKGLEGKSQMMCGITCFSFQLDWPLDGCLLDCPLNNIVQILDDKKFKVFPSINCSKQLKLQKVKVEMRSKISAKCKKHSPSIKTWSPQPTQGSTQWLEGCNKRHKTQMRIEVFKKWIMDWILKLIYPSKTSSKIGLHYTIETNLVAIWWFPNGDWKCQQINLQRLKYIIVVRWWSNLVSSIGW